MNPSRILAGVCAVVAALLPTSLLAQWNNSGTQLAPVPPISTVSPTTGSGPVVTYQPGAQFGTPPTVTGPPANSAPVITSQPGTQNVQPGTQFSQPGVQYGQPGMQYGQPGIQYGQPGMQYGQPGTGAPVITGPQASQTMPPPPNTFGGATHDPYYQPLPGTASPPPAALGTPMLPGGMNWGTFGSVAGITPRAGGGTRIGEDVGLDEGFTWMQGFVPVFQTPGQSITFLDGRALKYHENSDAFGYNIALGYRWFSSFTNRVNGFYAGYDYRNTGSFDFDQISFGADSLGQLWDFRANAHLLLENDTKFISVTDLAYQGNNLIGTANFLDAYDGVDFEAGRNFTPGSPTMDVRVFGGFYGFFSDGSKDAWGVRGRVEATWWDRVSAGASVQYDEVFDTTIFGHVSVLFGGANRANPCACPSIADRLGDPLHKNMHVVLNRRSEQVTINNPADNQPLQILHIDSNAAAGGDGTFETPFNTLTDAEAGNNADIDILLAHAGSQFNDETLEIAFADQRLLGDSDSVPHTTPSQFGTLTLPRANALAAKPIFLGAAVPATGSAVIVSEENVEVSGLRIQDPDGHGILVQNDGLMDFNLNRNMISGADFNDGGIGDGILLDNDATGSITENTIFGGNENGLRVAGNFNGTIADNMSNGNDMNGFLIEGEFQSGTISGNTAIGNTIDGFFFDTIAGGLVDANFAGANGDDGFQVDTAFTGGMFNNNTANNNTASGYDITGAAAPATADNNNGAGNGADDMFDFP